ncbi:MAG: hypothetical protein CAPSK01_000506 [Candidatus Accumulibacter vicinus]|uniref:Uncharacterized protein n=1 Tax=Candidatus Accumulibacter vicinus TaxID=2954382 RepID=A0A084Y4Z9_9PROT|nr:MAG: hypothetical protein CAPSK01_000506 [Candidatus Accumulibacter vicinus]
MSRYTTAVRTQLQPLLAGISSTQGLASVIAEPRQHHLQQTHLTGDQLYRLIDVRAAAEMPEQREGGDLGDSDDGNHQQHCPSSQRSGKESHPASASLALSGTNT